MGFPGSSACKEYTCNGGDPSSIPGSGRSPGEGISYPLQYFWASLVAQMINNLPAMWENWVHPWVRKISWRRVWQPTPIFLPRESPRSEEPGRSQSMGPQRVGQDRVTKYSTSNDFLGLISESYFPELLLCQAYIRLASCINWVKDLISF